VKRTVEKGRDSGPYRQPSAPRTPIRLSRIPAVNCWAIFSRPLTRTGRRTFCAKSSEASVRLRAMKLYVA
jgi:hypothetical protein